MEIQVGEYIRTYDGVIDKLEEITKYGKTDTVYWFDKTIYRDYEDSIEFLRPIQFEEYIQKHSFNIIDLIEYGDYVNKEFVGSVNHEEKSVEIGEGWTITHDKIKNVVTKELFESIKYEV